LKDRKTFVESLRWACHVPGFFYIKNHGISEDLCKRAFQVTKQFFELPLDKKLEIENIQSPHFRGYAPVGKEKTRGQVDQREQIDFGLEVDPEPLSEDKPPYYRLHGPNQWPSERHVPGFRSTFNEFMSEMQRLAERLMEAIALSLQLSHDYFAKTFQHKPHIRMKVINYPKMEPAEKRGDQPPMPFGVGEHKDYGFLSLLMQDDVGGLQALNGDGNWIDVVPIPGTFVVNIGEMLEVCTGGYYIATVHRVLVQKSQEFNSRISIPYFFNPRLDAEIVPIQISKELPFERKVFCFHLLILILILILVFGSS